MSGKWTLPTYVPPQNTMINRYLLYVIDIFSRYAWSVPLKDKTGTSIKAALNYLFRNRNPITLQSDKGTEFVNATFHKYLRRKDVNFHTTQIPT